MEVVELRVSTRDAAPAPSRPRACSPRALFVVSQYGGNVNQSKMTATMDRMAARARQVAGKPTSLLDLGYNNVGLDDNWQACGTGVNGSFHDIDGTPLINTKTFPSMADMTAHGHKLGLRVGWCECHNHVL
jgi:hypothetical protein